MNLYKIVIGRKKRFYESERTFEQNWTYHSKRYIKFHDLIAYQLDYEKKDWKEIRREKSNVVKNNAKGV